MPDLTFIEFDDWVAVYADERLIYSGHSLDWRFLLDYLQIERKVIDVDEIDGLSDHWYDPSDLTDALTLIEEVRKGDAQ